MACTLLIPVDLYPPIAHGAAGELLDPPVQLGHVLNAGAQPLQEHTNGHRYEDISQAQPPKAVAWLQREIPGSRKNERGSLLRSLSASLPERAV